MSLQIEQHETENRELKLTVQVDETRVEQEIRKAARQLAGNLRIPGFRPGKAPFNVIERWVGAEGLRAKAADAMAQDIYREAIVQAAVEPFAPGALDKVDLEPMVFHLTVPLEPVVDLGDYRAVRVDPPQVEVTDEQVNQALKAVQERHALLEPAQRPAQPGDIIIADLKIERGDEVLLDRQAAELLLDPETLFPQTPWVENVVGLSAGEDKRFELADPEQEDSVLSHSVRIKEVKSRYLPPLNDNLAKEESFDSLLEMRIDVRRQLTEAAQRQADAKYVDAVFDRIREGAQVTYPPVAVELELDDMVKEMEEHLAQQGWKLEEMLSTQGKTLQTLRQELAPQAKERVQRSRITLAILRAERISMKQEDLDRHIDQRLGDMGNLDEKVVGQLRELYSTGQGRLMMANDALMERFAQRMQAIGRGEAPELPETTEEEE